MAKVKFGAWIPTYAWSGESDPKNMKRIRASIEAEVTWLSGLSIA